MPLVFQQVPYERRVLVTDHIYVLPRPQYQLCILLQKFRNLRCPYRESLVPVVVAVVVDDRGLLNSLLGDEELLERVIYASMVQPLRQLSHVGHEGLLKQVLVDLQHGTVSARVYEIDQLR